MRRLREFRDAEISAVHMIQTVMSQLDPAQMSGTVLAVPDVSRPALEGSLAKATGNVRTILSCQTVNFVAPTTINRRAAHARYRASRCLRVNNIATTAKTSGQITLASGPTVPPVSHCGPFKVTLKRLCDGVNPLLGTP